MTAWWLRDQARLRTEKEAIEALRDRVGWLDDVEWSFDDALRIQVIFDIRLDHAIHQLRLVYHNSFPSSPPGVAPTATERLSGHQYGQDGDLCLEIRPDNWLPHYTGANMIESAFNLLSLEAPQEHGEVTPAPSAHNVPETLLLRSAVRRFYLTPAAMETLLQKVPDGAEASLSLHFCGDRPVVLHLLKLQSGDWNWTSPDAPPALAIDGYVQKGIVVRTSRPASDFDVVRTAYDLFGEIDTDIGETKGPFVILMVCDDHDILLFRIASDDTDLSRYKVILQPEELGHRSGESYDILAGKRVGVVGLGSLGAKIAVSLCRSGVGRFDLVDADILHGGNLERHDGDWRDVGLHKADGLTRRLRLISPVVEVRAWFTEIGAQVSTSEAGNVNGALSACNVIIDATGNPECFNHLTGLVLREDGTLVWGGVFAGGIGGHVGRSRPAKDPNPFIIRAGLNEFYAEVDKPPPETGDAEYDGFADGTPLIAFDADAICIAAHMTALAIDALIEREPTEYTAHAYLIGLKRAWIFDGPFDVRPFVIDAPIRVTSSPSSENQVEKDFIDTLFQKKLHEIANRSADN